jgi:membrane-associated phospholipid phosphatase
MKFYILFFASLFIIPLSAQKKTLGDVLQVNTRNLITLNSAAVSVQSPDLLLFGNIGNNIVNSFKGDNLYLHLAGVASTVLIVTTNTDYHVHKFFYDHKGFGEAARPVIYAGMFIPFVTGGSLFAYGKFSKDDRAVAASFAVLQSSLVTFLYNSLLKAITGRPNPDWQHHSDMKELSKTFRFGFMRGGIFWGWPSGHTSSTMAVVSALTNFYPEKTWLKIAGYSLVAYMIYGVSSLHRGGMHWFSDAVAAALMSYAIGSTIGKYYRSKFEPSENSGRVPPGMEFPLVNLRFVF